MFIKRSNSKRGLGSKRKIKIIAAAAAALVITTGGVIHHKINAAAAMSEAVEETATVEKMDLQKSITLNGTIISAESKSISSTISDAEVKAVNVKVGDSVRKGDVIAILGTEKLEKQLELAEASLDNTVQKSKMDIDEAGRSLANAQNSMNNQNAER
ncbi:biotin/lipoyl-containing protein [Oribacterium sp. P6A1]|uniref:biotin/lipoyl-containing protein n=1 Tax=Oribacterium sp. P6A1 TaxID=1410612 RepID=UPI000567A897|nr:biotin/lipoyl-binding protein [Oribacterium sp. P6A1]